MKSSTLDTLFATIEQRAQDMAEGSYTADMLRKGRPKIAQKLGEEAIECVIEVVENNADLLVEESADLLYHLTLAWYASGVKPQQVWDCLQARMDKGEKPE